MRSVQAGGRCLGLANKKKHQGVISKSLMYLIDGQRLSDAMVDLISFKVLAKVKSNAIVYL